MRTRLEQPDGRIILAFGESTGHCHEVQTDTDAALSVAAQFFEVDGRRELVVCEPCVLTHQEHAHFRLHPDGRVERLPQAGEALQVALYPAPIRQGDVFLAPLGPGVWEHVQQREQPEPEVWRAVAD